MSFHLTEAITVAAPGRRLDFHGNEREYHDGITLVAIGGDENHPNGTYTALIVECAFPSSVKITTAMTLDDLDALRQAITRLLVKVQAEIETQSPTAAPMPAAATGMVAGIASVHTPASVVA
jgi:hypothetical protein